MECHLRDIARDIDISCRRVNQIWKYFKDHGREPIIGKGVGRPRKPYDEKEAQIVKDAHCDSGSARECSRSFSRRCIMSQSLIIGSTCTSCLRDSRFEIRRNRSDANGSGMNVKHSMSAGHIDWHEDERTGMKVCVILDDASRKVLAGGEFLAINTENSILVVDQMVWNYWWLCPMRELIMDHGTEFGGNRIQENSNQTADSRSILKNLVLSPLWQESSILRPTGS